MTKIIIANWKMSPATLEEAKDLFSFVVSKVSQLNADNLQVIVCPPFVFIEELYKMLDASHPSGLGLGAQDIFWESSGAYTGEISTEMLKNFKISHVLIGHSDRRYVLGESDETINKKIKAALTSGIKPVLLVGERETDDIREDVLVDQISRDLEGLTANEVSQILFAYEPVWAISTNPGAKADTPENALAAVKFIAQVLARSWKLEAGSYLYGGSVNQQNINSFLNQPGIIGAVVGGASLRKEEFGKILEIASQ